ncbi:MULTISPECIES: amidohydrolase [unclassified Duganella]|uniref:amidohydrolase family protein n=1 Tax=unclassified Duganella TaxID=2636909 RepID=UPI000E3513BC|nr:MULTISPECIES: amidohydrolase [unclassified Duganella]RFP19103.1 amidohydrolase [Duganella sp. BJB475]RFP35765.1 amidohydrolase [Duganella sp. BJB476]
MRLIALLFAALAPVAAWAQSTAFLHVNVVPMDSERVLRDQTVLVKDGRIEAVGAALPAPAGYRVVDGHATAWLSPGLADMHSHSETRNDLALYLANGVTTLLNMGGARANLVDSIVPAVARGTLPGPHVYASLMVDGTPDYNGLQVKTPAQARAVVDLAAANGYDFIKVYVGLAPDVFSALAEAGRAQGLPLVGHGVTAVRLERQLAQGQVLVAHLEEFFYTYFTPPGGQETDAPPDEARIPEAVALAKRHGAAVIADLVTYHAIASQLGHPEVLQAILAAPQTAYVAPADVQAWRRSGYGGKSARLEAKLAFLRKLTKAMADGGVELLSGTDAPTIPGVAPGYSLHDNLAELESSHLSRYQALATATSAPGTFIARTKGGVPFGQVVASYRADLVLTEHNPLDGLSTLRTPLGVMAEGRWRDQPALAELLAGVRSSYRELSNDAIPAPAKY